MNRRLFKHTLLFLSFLLIFSNLFGIQAGSLHAEPLSETAVTISAVDYEGEEVLPLTAVSFNPGENAYDVLKAATEKRNLELETVEYEGMGHVIEKIGDVEGSMPYYWSFITQGEYAQVGVSSYHVKNGDNIKFVLVSMDDGMDAPKVNATVSAKDLEGNYVIDPEEVNITTGSTAYDALYQAAKSQGMDLDVSVDENYFTFIKNIGDTKLADNSFWSLSVNSDYAEVGAVQYILTDGDIVEFTVESFEDSSGGDSDEDDGDTPHQPSVDKMEEYVRVQQQIESLYGYVDEHASFEYGSEWWIWGLAHKNFPIPNSYIDSMKEVIQETEGQLGGLELQKVIISLSLLGEDASNFAGVNLIDVLVDNTPQAINGFIYTLLAIDSNSYDVPEGYREGLIEDILAAETVNSGWTFFGNQPSVDITSMALTSLAPYQENLEVKGAINRAVTYLSEAQTDNGGFYEPFNGGDTSESVAQAITALASLGIDPLGEMFIKENGNLLSHLGEFKQADNGYSHVFGDQSSMVMSSQQALIGLVAYEKYVDNTGSVYQRPVINNNDGNEEDDETETDDKNENEENNKTDDDNTIDDNKNDNEEDDDVTTVPDANDNHKTDHDSGKELPKTATSIFNYLTAGILFVLAGAIFLFIKRRKLMRA